MLIHLLKFGLGIDQKRERPAAWRKVLSLYTSSEKLHFDLELRDEWRLLDGDLAKQSGTPQWRAHSSVSFGIELNDWAVKSHHSWYDGEHCTYRLGPFFLYRSGTYAGDCQKGLE